MAIIKNGTVYPDDYDFKADMLPYKIDEGCFTEEYGGDGSRDISYLYWRVIKTENREEVAKLPNKELAEKIRNLLNADCSKERPEVLNNLKEMSNVTLERYFSGEQGKQKVKELRDQLSDYILSKIPLWKI